MKHVFLCLAFATFTFTSPAGVRSFGREPIHLANSTNGLDAIINHPTRVSGTLGPIGLSSRFQYSGTITNFVEILGLYSKLPQPSHILYISAESNAESADVYSLSYELSLNYDGLAFLHLHVNPTTDLSFLKPLAGVNLENLPAPIVPIDPKAQQNLATAQNKIDQFLKHR